MKQGVVTDPVGTSWAPTQGILLSLSPRVRTLCGKVNTDGVVCLGGSPSPLPVAQKGFLEVDKLQGRLSVRAEEVIRYLRGCLVGDTSSG